MGKEKFLDFHYFIIEEKNYCNNKKKTVLISEVQSPAGYIKLNFYAAVIAILRGAA